MNWNVLGYVILTENRSLGQQDIEVFWHRKKVGKFCYITQLLLYQDSGDGYAFEQGDYSLSLLAWDDSKQKLKLKAVKKSRIYNREIKVNVVKYIPANHSWEWCTSCSSTEVLEYSGCKYSDKGSYNHKEDDEHRHDGIVGKDVEIVFRRCFGRIKLQVADKSLDCAVCVHSRYHRQ